MAKDKKHYVCYECGSSSVKWMGRCPGCGNFNTLVEEMQPTAANKSSKLSAARMVPQMLQDITAESTFRIGSGIAELDRVLGGGFVRGSVVLVGGEPGIGKSTLLLQTVSKLPDKLMVLYVTGEESAIQVKVRAERLKADPSRVYVLADTSLANILAGIDNIKPDMVIIDSIQTMKDENLETSSGSVSQVRNCTSALLETAKRSSTTVVIVGHVTKDGMLAGPKTLEHMVDAVLYFEGDSKRNLRILRSVKNRFGSTNEMGFFEMAASGLIEVSNPSLLFLPKHDFPVSGSLAVAAVEGTRPYIVEVQGLVSASLYPSPRRVVSGMDYNRVSLIVAVLEKRLGIAVSQNEVYVNVVGGMKLDDTAADLGVALAVYSSSCNICIPPYLAVAGEIGLTGEVRSVGWVEQRVREAMKIGVREVMIAADSEILGSIPQDFKIHKVRNLAEAVDVVNKIAKCT